MQIVPVVRESYNKRYGTSYNHPDLLNPELNVRMATDLLRRITTAYAKHPDPNMKPDFTNPEFVKLLVAGWNSGYSEAGGVGRVAKYLESRKIPVTHDNVFAYASAAGATRHLSNLKKRNWQRSVSDLFFRQPEAPTPGQSSGKFLLQIGIAVAGGLILSKYVFK
jgi:soluble lytic murein transglycosylase-like protein